MSTLIDSVAVTTYDDITAASDETYYYWIKARNATDTSGYSSPDTGYIAAEMDAVSDLQASKGFSYGASPFILIQFTPPSGATHYDFYWSASTDFSAATKFDPDRQPFDNSESINSKPPGSTKNRFNDNETCLTYEWPVPQAAGWYDPKYIWVVAKKVSGGQRTS